MGWGEWEARACVAGGLPPAATIRPSMQIAIRRPMRTTVDDPRGASGGTEIMTP